MKREIDNDGKVVPEKPLIGKTNISIHKTFDNGRVYQSCTNCNNRDLSAQPKPANQVCQECQVTDEGLSNFKELSAFSSKPAEPINILKPKGAENNGGKTGYYDLPLPDINDICKILQGIQEGNATIFQAANAVINLCPQTLNDLIEYKNMKPWQHEVFKACYAIEERALKNGASLEREVNKILYYAGRGLEIVKKIPWPVKAPIINNNTFEDDYILQVLANFKDELGTAKDEAGVLDKYAVQLTAFMIGKDLK